MKYWVKDMTNLYLKFLESYNPEPIRSELAVEDLPKDYEKKYFFNL